jgi:hypothetical protein
LLLKPDEKLAAIFLANAQGVNASEFAQRMYEILAPAIKEATKDLKSSASKQDDGLARYTGSYESGFGGEFAVVEWEEGLAILGLPTLNPMRGLTKLKKVGEHIFRRVRKDDETLGESIVFEIGPDGRAARLVWHSNRYGRVR